MRLTAAEWGASGRTLPQVGGQADETVEILCAAELPFRHEGVVRRISQSENRTPESSFDLFGKMVDRADDRLVICADCVDQPLIAFSRIQHCPFRAQFRRRRQANRLECDSRIFPSVAERCKVVPILFTDFRYDGQA